MRVCVWRGSCTAVDLFSFSAYIKSLRKTISIRPTGWLEKERERERERESKRGGLATWNQTPQTDFFRLIWNPNKRNKLLKKIHRKREPILLIVHLTSDSPKYCAVCAVDVFIWKRKKNLQTKRLCQPNLCTRTAHWKKKIMFAWFHIHRQYWDQS